MRDETGSNEEKSLVHAIQEAAFARADEADLVDALCCEGVVLVSLVAELLKQGKTLAVGHILFTRMGIESVSGVVPAVALAPVAVLPEHQGQGIGSRLIRYGLETLARQGERIVLVLGHPEYYQRFGFSPAKARHLESPFPPDAYMALELAPGALDGIEGKVRYPAAFGL